MNAKIDKDYRFEAVDQNLDKVKETMSKNVRLALDRGENLDTLKDKSNDLEKQSSIFHKNAKKSKWAAYCGNCRIKLYILLVIVICIWIFSSSICGFEYEKLIRI